MRIFKNKLFSECSEAEYEEIMTGGWARETHYEKGARILRAGDRTFEMGIVLSGSVNIESLDLWGNRSILSHIQPGQFFAETYAFSQTPLMVDAAAGESCTVLFLNAAGLLAEHNRGRSWYPKLLYHLLRVSSGKNIALSKRIFCTSAKSARSRVMTYLSTEAAEHGQTDFTIPFDRQQMADYLNLDRSALSKELGRMRNEGLIAFRKNRFVLYQTEL